MPRNVRAVAERLALGRRIRAHRLALGLSHRDVAAHIGAGKASVYYVDTASKDVYLGTLIDVAGAVGLDVALVAEYHLPLLTLTADEVMAVQIATSNYADTMRGESTIPGMRGFVTALRSALDKLTTTDTTEETH